MLGRDDALGPSRMGFQLASSKERTRMAASDHQATGPSAVPSFEIRTVRVGEDLFLLLSGKLDRGSAEKLEGALWVAENRVAREVVVDLSDLRFMDTTGLKVLLEAYARSEQGGQRLRFVPSKYELVRQLIAVSGASRMFG
jgi:anti-anti-sigma factor